MGRKISKTDNGKLNDTVGDRIRTSYRCDDEPARLKLQAGADADEGSALVKLIKICSYKFPIGKSNLIIK